MGTEQQPVPSKDLRRGRCEPQISQKHPIKVLRISPRGWLSSGQ
jgi:hypothetical protein